MRGKLALGFAALLTILIFLGGESIVLLSRLGSSIDVILRENYRSVIASERMKEALERMDSAALFALGGELERGRALAAQNHPRFEEALQVELNNITLPGEGERAERLRQLYRTYRPALDDYFTGERSTEERRRLAREIEGGNLDASVPVTSHDELGRLAATFNSMAGSLRELRRSDQARLLRARQVSQQAIDQLPTAVAVFSDNGAVELVNATAASVLGLRPGEPLPPQHDAWISVLVNPAPGMVPRAEVRRLERDGEEVLFLPRTIPLEEDGRRLGTLLVLADVTEQRRSAELTSDLLATASRDLRNPLASLRAALDKLQGTAGSKDVLDSAVRDAGRMAQALDRLDCPAGGAAAAAPRPGHLAAGPDPGRGRRVPLPIREARRPARDRGRPRAAAGARCHGRSWDRDAPRLMKQRRKRETQMNARIATSLFLLILPGAALAQESPIATDRPGFLFSSLTVGRGVGQIELGLPSVTLFDGTDARTTSLIGLLRVGVSDDLELRLGAPLFTEVRVDGESDSGYGDLELGAKWHLLDNEGGRPSFALIPSVIVPTGEDGFSAEDPIYQLNTISEWTLESGWGVGLLAGFLRGEVAEDSYLQQTYALGLGRSLPSPEWAAYGEVAHVRTDLEGASDASFLGAGLKYLVSNDVQLDVSFDRGLTDESPDWLFGFGVAARF